MNIELNDEFGDGYPRDRSIPDLVSHADELLAATKDILESLKLDNKPKLELYVTLTEARNLLAQALNRMDMPG